jgi:hypothetical protein
MLALACRSAAGSDSVDTLGQEVTEGMSDIGGVPLGLSGSQACSAANLPVDPTQQAVLRAYPNNWYTWLHEYNIHKNDPKTNAGTNAE